MVDVSEIISQLLGAFAPFVGKAIIAIIILGVLGFLIDLAVSKGRKRGKSKDDPKKQE